MGENYMNSIYETGKWLRLLSRAQTATPHPQRPRLGDSELFELTHRPKSCAGATAGADRARVLSCPAADGCPEGRPRHLSGRTGVRGEGGREEGRKE